MTVTPSCPACGFVSDEMRCPRCNTLKVSGCSGACTTCGTKAACRTKVPAAPEPPSARAREDAEHPGTRLDP